MHLFGNAPICASTVQLLQNPPLCSSSLKIDLILERDGDAQDGYGGRGRVEFRGGGLRGRDMRSKKQAQKLGKCNGWDEVSALGQFFPSTKAI